MPRLEDMKVDAGTISRLFPAGVSVRIAMSPTGLDSLFPQEAVLVANANAGRRGEFAAGRAAARAALARLGAPPGPILRGPLRAPLWPEGFVGSITHCRGFACAVAARSRDLRSIGVDAEDAGPLEESLVRLVCAPDERDHFSRLPGPPAGHWAKLAFSAKEAFYKCLQPVTGDRPDFLDMSVRFSPAPDGDTGRYRIRLIRTGAAPAAPRMSGRWAVRGDRLYTGAALLD